MPTTLSQIQICNMALSRIGVKPIQALDTAEDIPSEQCNLNWQLALAELGRSHAWNCLMTAAQLTQKEQTPITPVDPVPASTDWAPATNYAVGDYVTFGDPAYLYQCLIANLSSASFTNDLTMGYWFQTDTFNSNPFSVCGGQNYVSGWAYKYGLPEELLLMVTLNDQPCDQLVQEYEIIGTDLYTNWDTAVIKYTWAQPDTTRYDPMFVECLVLKLAEMLATMLRQDDTDIATGMLQKYQVALHRARTKDAGERKPRRFNPAANSRFIQSRYYSTNH